MSWRPGHGRQWQLAASLAAIALVGARTDAHKTITSKYTFNEHVFPILRERCGRCHVDGGPTPMSLMTYKDAVPWAESIREQLTTEAMPPWYVDPMGPPIRGGHAITTKELDILVTWATGGTPEGDPAKAPSAVMPPSTWKAGPPDQLIPMSAAHTLAPGVLEETTEITLPTGLREEKWIRAVDLLPGTPSMVREALIATNDGVVLGSWVPGFDVMAMPNGTAFRLAAGATLRVRIRYKKHWQDEQNEKSDRSTIGLYFTDAPLSGHAARTLVIEPPASNVQPNETRTFSGRLASASRVLAVRPTLDQAYASLAVNAVLPAGRQIALLRLHAAQPRWPRRYWLVEPVELPAGTRLEVIAEPAPPESPLPASPTRLQIGVDFVPLS